MQVARKKIESNLPKKGFIIDPDNSSHHKYFHHIYKGRRTGIYTYTSRGSNYKTYGKELLGKMKLQLRLNRTRDVVDFVECTLEENDYNIILDKKGLL